jgi:hypothetical protein
MINRRIRFTFTLLFLASLSIFTTASAQDTVKHRYEVSSTADGGRIATVETSVSKELVSVAIIRQGQPTHHYRAYLSVKVTDASIGNHPLFSIYHNDQIIKAGTFNHKLSEVSGNERKGHAAIESVRRRIADDMRILRAVRGFDPDSCVLLAELDYVIVTYDSSIFEAAASDLFSVTKASGQTARRDKSAPTKLVSSRLGAAATHGMNDTLDGCISGAEGRFVQCRTDPSVGDKSICYNNRSTEVQQCYSIYGGKKPATEESQS